MSTFKEWLGKQVERRDKIGELAGHALSKAESAKWTTPRQLMARVAETPASEALVKSFREYAEATKDRAEVLRLLAEVDADD